MHDESYHANIWLKACLDAFDFDSMFVHIAYLCVQNDASTAGYDEQRALQSQQCPLNAAYIYMHTGLTILPSLRLPTDLGLP